MRLFYHIRRGQVLRELVPAPVNLLRGGELLHNFFLAMPCPASLLILIYATAPMILIFAIAFGGYGFIEFLFGRTVSCFRTQTLWQRSRLVFLPWDVEVSCPFVRRAELSSILSAIESGKG
jgi:hypothetical protein